MLQNSSKKVPTKLVFLLLVFIVPMFVSWGMYFFRDHLHFHTKNHGNLLHPVVAVSDIKALTNSNHQWQIIYIPSASHFSMTDKTLFTLNQLKKALGKDEKRVHLTLITDSTYKQTGNPYFVHYQFDEEQYKQLQKKLAQNNILDRIYLVDPANNLFMYYADSDDPMNIYKDMKHLLKVSQIG